MPPTFPYRSTSYQKSHARYPMDRSQRRDQRRRAPGRQRRSDRSVVRKGRKLMRFKLTPYAQNSLALTHPDLVHFPSPANHRVGAIDERSEEHTSELQSLMRISYDVFCLKKK